MYDGGTYSSYAEISKSPTALAKYWHCEIDAAKERRRQWMDDAKRSCDVFKQETKSDFNIHFSNVNTRVSARFNSSPVPDVRPTFFDDDKPAKAAALLNERALAQQLDSYDFDAVVRNCVMGDELFGEGQLRVMWDVETYEEIDTDEAGNEQPVQMIKRELAKAVYVPHGDYLEGPAKTWGDVPWVAFRMRWTRSDLEALGVRKPILDKLSFAYGPLGKKDDEDESQDAREKESKPIGREYGWLIWHKPSRTVISISDDLETDVLGVEQDPVPRLPGFFPCPRPLQGISLPGSRTPNCPYVQYESVAKSLNVATERIQRLTRIMKFRGIRASELEDLVKLETLDDGEFAPSASAMALLNQGARSLDDAFWVMPLDKLVVVLRELVGVQQYLKDAVYEVTGLTEAMRGASDPNKTATAETIEANFGSLRIHDAQKEVQRFVRDTLRLKSDIISAHFGDETLLKIDGTSPEDAEGMAKFEQALATIRSDDQRYYRVDIETDSTIQADLTRSQQNASKFLDSAARFATTFVPMIQQELIPPGPVLKLFSAIAGHFKLGKQAEMAVDELLQVAETQAQDQAQKRPQKEAEKEQAEQVFREAEMRTAAAETQKAEAEAEKTASEATGQELENLQHAVMGPEQAENFVGEGG